MIITYLTGGALNPAVAATHPLARNGTHICGVTDAQWNKRYADQYPNRRYARSDRANLNVGEPRTVRLIYFLPNDRPYQAEVVQRMKDEIRTVQTFYADQMEAHGYRRLTFRIETDSQGEPIVHRVDGQHPDSHYLDNTHVVYDELVEAFNFDVNIYITVIDVSTERINRTVAGTGGRWGKQSGAALIADFWGWYVVAHELGHAFGLGHDFNDNTYIMSYGHLAGFERWRLSACHAENLLVHPYFNDDIPIDVGDGPYAELISPHSYPSDSKSVSIRVRVSDPDGLHQVILHAAQPDNRWSVKKCRGLEGRNKKVIEFNYDGVIPSAHDPSYSISTSLLNPLVHPMSVEVVDTDGNVGFTHFVLFSEALEPLTKISGDNLQGLPNTPLPVPFVVELRDLNDGFPRYEVWVTFTVTAGGGTLSVERVQTDYAGRAESTLTLGPNFGTNTVEVYAEGHTVTFNAVAAAPVDIPDANLRAAIEDVLDKAPGTPIAPAEMARLTELQAPNANISDLTGLEHAINLRNLNLSRELVDGNWINSNSVSDLSPLSDLTSLTHLWLEGNAITDISPVTGLVNLVVLHLGGNTITDISPVTGLVNLTKLVFWYNDVTDISVLAGLTNLETLYLDGNPISDISVLAGLTNLTRLGLEWISVSDFSPLAELTNLTWLRLRYNTISDLSPLVANTGLGSGDTVDVRGNALNYASIYIHIPDLQSKGVTVKFDNRTPAIPLKISGDNQEGAPGTILDQSFAVDVQDQNGEAFAGVPVVFTVTAGGGVLSITSTVTDANGRAESTLTLGPNPGTNTVEVSVKGISQTAVFSAEAALPPPVPTTLAIVSGDNQNGLTGEPLANPFVVKVRDQYDAPMEGVAVTLAVSAGGGTPSPEMTITDANGQAESTLTLGPNPGTNTVTVSVAGIEGTVTFTAVATAPVEIPDRNLRAAIEAELKVPPHTPIAPAAMTTLTRLEAQNASISDLTGLEGASNLTYLDLGFVDVEGRRINSNSVSNLSPLAGLTSLTELRLWGNSISDVSALAELTNLTRLDISNNSISDISPLAGLINLTSLDLDGNALSNILAVAGLTNLTKLHLFGNSVSDLSPLSGLTNLTGLYLGGSSASDLSPLVGLTNLESLYLDGNGISDLSPLVGLTNLKRLALNNNSVKDLSPLAGLTSLRWMRLAGNSIVDISALVNLTHLTYLGLDGNSITDISAVAGLPNLTELGLGGNTITDLSPLVENTGLGNGDEVNVEQNPLNYVSLHTVIPVLQDRKVQIRFTRRTPGAALIISGIDQQGEPGVTLDRPFVVEVRDETGVPFEGVPVAFTVTAGGGTVQPETVHTGSDGLAETTLTLGSTPGANTVLATVDGIAEPVTFNAVGEVSDLVVDLPSVSKSTLAPGEKFTLSVTVRNQGDRRADGTTLHYYRSTDATISSSDTEVGIASVSGLDANEDSDYSISLTAPTAAGAYYYGACVDTVDNEIITANNCADGVEITVERVPTELVKLSGDNQSGVINQVLSSPFVVEVRDQDQTPLEAAPVMFAVIAGGGMLGATHTNTDASGLAETMLTLGSTPGTNTVLATVDGITEPVTFNAVGEGIEFDLSMSVGTNLIHVPLKVTAVDGVAKTMESISDLYDAFGGTNAVNFLITYDSSTQAWLSYFSPSDRGSASDRGLTAEIGIIAIMKTAVTVRLRGEALGIAGSSVIALNQGLNLVGLPLRDPTINRVSDLLRLDGIWGNVDVIILNDGGDFKIVGRAGDPGDVVITGGQGFILAAQQTATVAISGEGWTNDLTAAPQILTGLPARHTTPVLALKGSIVDEVSAVNQVDFRVAVKNLSTGRQVVTTIADAEAGYRLAIVDIETMRAARFSDVLEISAQSTNPFIGVEPLRYAVTAEDVSHGWIQLPALVAYEIPAETELSANYPNPFNPETWIPYRLAEDAFVTLTIYDLSGQVIRTLDVGHRIAAAYESRSKAVYWDGRNDLGEGVASGVYFYHLSAGDYSATQKMVILK